MSQTADLRIRSASPLIAPDVLELEFPVPQNVSAFVQQSRREISAVVSGADDRLLAIVGPCSVHDPVAAVEYAARLKEIAVEFSDCLLLVMRVYFEKPRTVAGWKGLINDPGLDESFQINRGLRTARKLLLEISEVGLPIATEFLDAHFNDRGRLLQADRGRRFSAIVDAQGMRASEGLNVSQAPKALQDGNREASGLSPQVQTYPRRRAALATYRPTRWVSRLLRSDVGGHWSLP